MDIQTILSWAELTEANDIELYDELRDIEEGITNNAVPAMRAFAEHGSGSQYAIYEGHVVWIDSEGDQYTIARNVDELVDALHLPAGALYDAMSACEGSSGREETELASIDELRERFGAEWMAEQVASARADNEGYAAFEEKARELGRGVPTDLVDRLVALRGFTKKLRAVCMD
jgi:hypothetical protein